jgi:hypothetical protein
VAHGNLQSRATGERAGDFSIPGTARFSHAARAFGGDGEPSNPGRSALPAGAEARQQSIELLRAKGIDAVIPFHTMLEDLIDQIEVNRNYQKSDLLQVIRILKNYGFFKEPQLELFKPRRKPARKKSSSD